MGMAFGKEEPRSGDRAPHAAHCVRGGRLRFALLSLIVASALAQASPWMLAAGELNRRSVVAGQWWRLLTGNFVHFGWGHFLADMTTLAALCWLARRDSIQAAAAVVISAFVIGPAVLLFAEDVARYRGASGVVYSLLAWLLIRESANERSGLRPVWLGMLGLLLAKTVFEILTGKAVFSVFLPSGIQVVGVAHLSGMLTGGAVGLIGERVRPLSRGPERA